MNSAEVKTEMLRIYESGITPGQLAKLIIDVYGADLADAIAGNIAYQIKNNQ